MQRSRDGNSVLVPFFHKYSIVVQMALVWVIYHLYVSSMVQ